MRDLSKSGIEARYDSHQRNADIIDQFYTPLLSNCNRYDRKSGYFSSSILAAACNGFSEFCKAEGAKMRMITGVKLYERDADVIQDPTNEELKNIINGILEERLDETLEASDFEKQKLAGLAWMLETGILEIKIGVILDKTTGKVSKSEMDYYHHKEGIAYDDAGNSIHFTGGINESAQAWDRNGDSITVHRSWTNNGDVFVNEFIHNNFFFFFKVSNFSNI